LCFFFFFFFSSRRRHTRFSRDWSSDVCSSDLLSPDGTKIALAIGSGTMSDIWILDRISGTRNRLTTDATSNLFPEWTPDGKRLRSEERRVGKEGRSRRSSYH